MRPRCRRTQVGGRGFSYFLYVMHSIAFGPCVRIERANGVLRHIIMAGGAECPETRNNPNSGRLLQAAKQTLFAANTTMRPQKKNTYSQANTEEPLASRAA